MDHAVLAMTEHGAGGLPNTVMLRSALASMKFAALKRSRQFKVLMAMLADAGKDTCETAVRLIELPNTIATPMGPFRGDGCLRRMPSFTLMPLPSPSTSSARTSSGWVLLDAHTAQRDA